MTDSSAKLIEVVVSAVTSAAHGIGAWELRRPDAGELPAFTAGAHIDLHLANGLMRSYSLCNAPQERHRYVVAINKDAQSRGGSSYIHQNVKVGDRIPVSAPRNNFPLNEDATHSVFIAGGIGITPMWCMIQRLESIGRSWELYYSTRSREMCAFKQELVALEQARAGRVHFNFDQEPGGSMIDLRAVIEKASADTHLYCCGPGGMIQAFERTAQDLHRPGSQLHVEYFTAAERPADEGGYTVVLRRSGRTVEVAPGMTILETLFQHNIEVPYSCMEGVCGQCETRVLEGIPDHRDSLLSQEERASGSMMMICCSGSKGPKLVLDR